MSRVGSVLLDTSVIVDYLRGDERLPPRLTAVGTMYVPLVVLGELHFGAQRVRRRDDALTRVREFLRIATLPLPHENTAERYGEVKAELAGSADPFQKTTSGSPPWPGSTICR